MLDTRALRLYCLVLSRESVIGGSLRDRLRVP